MSCCNVLINILTVGVIIACFNASPISSQSNQSSAQQQAIVLGLRVEASEELSYGYNAKGACIINPDTEIKIVIFGLNLEYLASISFTTDNQCENVTRTVTADQFLIHFDHKAIFMLSLPLLPGDVDVYKTCVRQRNPALNVDLKPLDDVRTFFTTEHPPREHYLPLPIQVSIIACLLVLSALFSGLTLGLMSLTPMELELVEKSGSPTEQSYASAILPVRRKGNLLLCALLLGNVIVNSAISILFGDLTSGFLALFISSAGIVVFGEIIPQSICVKKGLAIGANTILITRLFILMTFPLAWPISKLLDYLLGDEYVAYDRKRLMELIKLSVRDDTSGLADELKIAVGAMEIADKVVKDVMTKITDVFMLPDTTVLNTKNIAEIVRMGYTRIPVYAHGHKNTVTDILFVKDLALIDPDDNFTIKTVCGYHKHPVKFVDSDAPLRGVLEEFKKGDAHLAMVRQLAPDSGGDPLYELVGIVTLEDIVEEILQAEIVDEFDVITDNVNRIKRINYQNRDLSKFFEKETAETQISMQIQLVAEQWLVANEPAFDESLIDRGVLQRLIRTCARHVDVSSLMALSGGEPVVVPRIAKFYTKGELSDRFILILEGRATVTIGKGELNFEAGPWHSFGGEVMKKLLANAKNLARSSSIADAGELNAIRRPDLAFVPDYSITVPDECTFLEITTTTYINAYRATLMQREIGRQETLGVPMEVPCLLDDQTEGELNDESGRPTELETIPLENIDSSPIAPQSPHDAASPLSRRSKSESDGEERCLARREGRACKCETLSKNDSRRGRPIELACGGVLLHTAKPKHKRINERVTSEVTKEATTDQY